MIYSFFGQPGSGKTTLGISLYKYLKKVYGWEHQLYMIDGDKLRELITNKDYSNKGRKENIIAANNIATYLNHNGADVIISMVNPFRDLRASLKKLNKNDVKEIYLISDRTNKLQFHVENFEAPKTTDLTLNTSELIVQQCLNKIVEI